MHISVHFLVLGIHRVRIVCAFFTWKKKLRSSSMVLESSQELGRMWGGKAMESAIVHSPDLILQV